jgi:hypothetical protein
MLKSVQKTCLLVLFSILLISRPPYAHYFPTDARRLFPNRLYLTSIPSLVRDRPYTPNELSDTTSNTKVNCLCGNETNIRVSPRARVPHNAGQTRETVWVINRFGCEDEVVGSSCAVQIKRVP